jgi:hypothetical protein
VNTHLQKIEIKNFKVFRDFTLDLDGRHLLVYGANGAGKSSLYWALYTFLQSARKSRNAVSKYFDPANPQNLLNYHEQSGAAPKSGEIQITLKELASATSRSYKISQSDHGTYNEPAILNGDRASDFITYRFFFGFSHFRNSETFDLWPLFEKEILPFCVSTGGLVPFDVWNQISSGKANRGGSRGVGGSRAYTRFKEKTDSFAAMLPGIVNGISVAAQKFYDEHFAVDDLAKITFKIAVTVNASYDVALKKFTRPVIEFGVQVGGKTITRPQSFLNEAKLTQLALSVRFAASLVNLRTSDLKLLVIDDLLVSLDMSNRMKAVEIILSSTFSDYQKIILTHDRGFFEETHRRIGHDQSNWLFANIQGNAKDGAAFINKKSDLELAQDYLANDQLEECGNRLRKHAEASLENFLRSARTDNGVFPLVEKGDFSSLGAKIKEAINLLDNSWPKNFAELLQKQFSADDLNSILSTSEIDPAQFRTLSKNDQAAAIGKLYSSRRKFHQSIIDFMSDASRRRLNAVKLLEQLEHIKDRILNPASHAGVAPIYTKEAKDAIKVIQSLDSALTAALAAL